MSGARHEHQTPEWILDTTAGRLSGKWLGIWLGAIAIGVIGLGLALGSQPQRAWMSVWSNFLFWTSIAMAGIVFGAILSVAKGHWGKNFRRVAEAAGAFLPISLVIFLAMYAGFEYVLPWLGPVETEHLNRIWLTREGVFGRNAVLLAVLYAMAFAFLWYSLRADAPLVAGKLSGWRQGLARTLSRGWRGDDEEVERCRHRLALLSPALILAWVLVSTLLSYDLAMSLTPGFISMIWGPSYFIGGWLSLLALVAFMGHRYQKSHGHGALWGAWDFHDIGKLMFGFVVFWTYLWFAQFLVIWYGNLPREVNYFSPRIDPPFRTIFWLQMVLIFLLPFFFLLGRKPKMNPAWLAFVAVLILIGFWVQRYNLVVPSIWEGGFVPLGWPELSISIGFLGLFGLAYALFASTFPKLPIRETIAVGSASKGP